MSGDDSAKPLLALESGGLRFSAALSHGGGMSFRESDSDSPEHSRVALPLIRELLDEAGIALSDCGAVAFGAGPGRFSGLRMSCAFAQSFAYATGASLVSVSSLAALAAANFGCDGHDGRDELDGHNGTGESRGSGASAALASFPAHRGHAYLALCVLDANGIWRADNPLVVCEDDFSESDAATFRKKCDGNLCGEGWTLRPKLSSRFPDCKRGAVPNPDARAVLALAEKMLRRGETTSPLGAVPQYAREKIALTPAERRAGKTA